METMLGDVWNGIGDSWADWMWAMTWQAAVLLAIIWATTRLAFKSSASFRYCLWLLLFVKLLLPPTLSTPWSPANALAYMPELTIFAEQAPAPSQQGTPAPESASPVTLAMPATPPSSTPFPEDASVEPSAQDAEPVIATVQETGTAPVKSPFTILRASTVFAIWAVVALSMALFIVLRYRTFKRAVLRDVKPVDDTVQAMADAQAEKLGLHRAFRLCATPHLSIPAVFCLREPVVLLPETLLQTLPRKQLANLIGHELAHLKRRDIEIGWFVSMLICLYWFHPAVWLANLYLRREREMACDDKVLYATRQEGKEYAATIVGLVESFDKKVPVGAGFFGLIEVADNLLQRIRSAVDGARPRRAGRRSFATVVLLILLAMPMGVWTTSAPADAETSAIDNEIAEHYAKADAEVQEFVRWTAEFFGPQGLWLPADEFAGLSADERAAEVAKVQEALEGPNAINEYEALARAGALADPALIPGLSRVALYMKEGGQDNRSKWMAVAALGRTDDKSAVPTLIPLVDHYNKNVRIWAQASLARISGENLGADKEAWFEWARDIIVNSESTLDSEFFEKASRQSQEKMAAQRAESPPPDSTSAAGVEASADAEIAAHYAKADADVQEYVRWTARTFSRSGLWQPAGAFDALSADEREKKITYMAGALNSEYGRHLCSVLAEAGAIKDPRLMPGLTKAAAYHRDDGDYDCRPKWMAVSALGRQDDISAVPVLVPLVDHGNQNTRMWARASLVRLTGENFSDDKQAWGRWWNESGHEPKIDLAELKPWTMAGPAKAQQTEAAPPVQAAVIPADLESRVEHLPGKLEFKGTYIHKSRGGEYAEPGTVWIKRTENNELNAIAYLPSLGTTYFAHIQSKDDNSVVWYEQGAPERDGRPAWKQILEFGPDTVGVKYEGGERDGETKTIPRPADSFFWPNTRPDPYLVPMGLFLKERGVRTGEPAELPLYDWDNTGEGFATYKVRWESKGMESVTVPAGTFTANHLTETQITPSDTWYKKYQGLVTDYWILDSGVVVRILRNREPYELLLAAMETDESAQPEAAGTAKAEPAATPVDTTQAGIVHGSVLDAVTGEPIANAFVAVDHSGDAGGSNLERFHSEGLYSTTTTDSDGRFVLDNLALREDHPFYATAPGHTRHDQTVALSKDMTELELLVKLDPSATLTVTTAETPGSESTAILRLAALDGHLFYPPKADWPAWPYMTITTRDNTATFGELKLGGYRVQEVRLADAPANTFVYAGAAEVDLRYGEADHVTIAPTAYDTHATLTIAPAPNLADARKFIFTLGTPIGNLPEPGTVVSPEGEILGRIISSALLVNFAAGASYFELSLDKPLEFKGFPPGRYRAAVVRMEALPESKGAALCLRWATFELVEGEEASVLLPHVKPILPDKARESSSLPPPPPNQSYAYVPRPEAQDELKDPVQFIGKLSPRLAYDVKGSVIGITSPNIAQSPVALKMGFQNGDIVQAINGEPIQSEQDVFELINKYYTVPVHQVTVLRNGTSQVLTIQLGDPATLPEQGDQATPPKHGGTLYGQVLDAVTGTPVAGAFVAINHTGVADGANLERFREEGLWSPARANSDGQFTLDNLALRDDHPFYVTAQGYVRHMEKVALSQEEPDKHLEVRLERAASMTATLAKASGFPCTSIVRLWAKDGQSFYPTRVNWPAWHYQFEVSREETVSFENLEPGSYRVEQFRLEDMSVNSFVYGGSMEVELQNGGAREISIKPASFDTHASISIVEEPTVDNTPVPMFALCPTLLDDLPEPGTVLSSEYELLERIYSSALVLNRAAMDSYFTMAIKEPVSLSGFPPGEYTVAVMLMQASPEAERGVPCLRWATFELIEGEEASVLLPHVKPKLPDMVN